MMVTLDDYYANTDMYMRIACIENVYITDVSKQVTWVLTTERDNSWAAAIISLFATMQNRMKHPAATGV